MQGKVKGNLKPNDKSLQIIHEFSHESHDQGDMSAIPDHYEEQEDIVDSSNNTTKKEKGHNESSAHIELFLKTATAQEMDLIRESLSNF